MLDGRALPASWLEQLVRQASEEKKALACRIVGRADLEARIHGLSVPKGNAFPPQLETYLLLLILKRITFL